MEKITNINPTVLAWCRKTQNLTIEIVAEKLNKNKDILLKWENGSDFPTYSQLEKLANIYRKPLALFFFSNVPEIDSIETSCRTINNKVFETLSPNLIKMMNEAKVMQYNLMELYDGQNPSSFQISDFPSSSDIDKSALMIREIFGIKIESQKSIKSMSNAFEFWRDIFFQYGIYIFKNAFHDDSISGFCLYDNNFPIIYINNSMTFSRQIFTLFHELYHLLYRSSGIDSLNDNYLNLIDKDNKKIELECNDFAGKVLVPTTDFMNEISKFTKIDDKSIEILSKKYSVSREVIIRKMYENNIVSFEFLQNKVDEFKAEFKRFGDSSKKSGGNYYNTISSYLGKRYLAQVFKNYYNNNIDIFSVADYTHVKVEHINRLERTVQWR